MIPEQSPIIIYGAPRSGTTYLCEILNHHPDVFISGESRVFLWVQASLNNLTQRSELLWYGRKVFVEHLRKQYPELIRGFYQELSPGAKYWGDKYPHYAAPVHRGCLETIRALFPSAKFIHIIRDG